MSLYLHEFEIILEMRFQALRLTALISVSRYLHDFGHLGDMCSNSEARNLEAILGRSSALFRYLRISVAVFPYLGASVSRVL